MDVIHVIGFMQSQAYVKCSMYLSYHSCYLPGHVACLSHPGLQGAWPSVRSANVARQGDLGALCLLSQGRRLPVPHI